MIRIEEAYKLVTGAVAPMATERIDLKECLHRVLAEDVISDVDMPPFDKSAMDGYACRIDDISDPLKLIETIPAGKAPENKIGKGECAAIMTGAPVPEGADCVIMVELTRKNEHGDIIYTGNTTKANIAYKAEDVSKGDILIEKGTFVEPQHMAILAATGYDKPEVSVKPKVGIISTGDEIVEPNEEPGISKIRNSNAYQLIGQVQHCGAIANYIGIAHDNEQATLEIISSALKEHDVILLTGGISMGQFDFIPKVFEKLDVEVLFQTLAVQPGKPTLFGKIDDKRIFGLPGNPVSAFNTFELLVRPYLRLSMGAASGWKMVKLLMGTSYTRKKSNRDSFVPVRVKDGKAYPEDYHGSAHIQALTQADGFIKIPLGTTTIEEGTAIDVRQI